MFFNSKITFHDTESANGSMKKRVLIIFQNLQENTCVGVSFLIKLQASGDSDTGVFLLILRSFQEHIFPEHFRWLLFTIKKIWEVSFSFSIFLFALVLHWWQRKNEKWKDCSCCYLCWFYLVRNVTTFSTKGEYNLIENELIMNANLMKPMLW